MIGKAAYPNPFASLAAPTSCVATCELTQGPCYSSQSIETRDISYGHPGLPMRMAIQVLDEACKPVAGAVVDVWHVSAEGKYSGNDEEHEDVGFCTGGDEEFASHLYFRGKQTTDAGGVVLFDTCYPGWYRGRTVHVHLTIDVGGQAYVTTQLCFDDALDDEIVKTQALYATRGARDTTNAEDGVFSGSEVGASLFETKKLPDGAMLAWKRIVVRSSLAEALCGGGGGWGGHGGPGRGPPPGGPGGRHPPAFGDFPPP